MANTVILKDVRLSYPELFTPREYTPGDGKPRFSASFLVEPGSDNHKNIMAGIQSAMKEKFGAKAKIKYDAMKNDSKSFCYVNGDLKDDDTLAGVMVLAAHRQARKGAPAVVDRNPSKKLQAEDGKPYAGCYVNAKVEIYVQDKSNVGVRCELLGVQFSKDGEAFAGGPADASGFDDLSDGTDADDFGNADDDFADEPAPKGKAKQTKKSDDDFDDDF